jgi:hypothetical protein
MQAAWEYVHNVHYVHYVHNKKKGLSEEIKQRYPHVDTDCITQDLQETGPYQLNNCQFLKHNSAYGVTMKIAG